MINSVKGWVLVDGEDGVQRLGLPTSPVTPGEVVTLEPVFVRIPQIPGVIAVPQMQPGAAIRAQQPQMQIVPAWLTSDASNFSTVLGLPWMGKWTGRVVGVTQIDDMPGPLCAVALRIAQQIESACVKGMKDVLRQATDDEKKPNGPRPVTEQ